MSRSLEVMVDVERSRITDLEVNVVIGIRVGILGGGGNNVLVDLRQLSLPHTSGISEIKILQSLSIVQNVIKV